MSYFGKFSDADKRRRIKTREVVQESQAVRRVPYVVSDFVTTNLIRLVMSRFTARKLLTEFTHNIYFTTAYILAVVGVFNYLRFYHRDQFRSYGLNGHSPGVAEQMQPHNVATFNFVTLPTVLEKSKLLLPSEATLPNQLAQFAITPFVDRVDVYPESLVVQFNEAWADVMARNFYITYPLATEHLRSPTHYLIRIILTLWLVQHRRRFVRYRVLGLQQHVQQPIFKHLWIPKRVPWIRGHLCVVSLKYWMNSHFKSNNPFFLLLQAICHNCMRHRH